jgi:ubiquinone/menaquinone biosynthesis C-methylase UbiE
VTTTPTSSSPPHADRKPDCDHDQPVVSIERSNLIRVLADYERQTGAQDYDSAEAGRSTPLIFRRHVEIFLRYRAWLNPGVILDWGCGRAPDACLLRTTTPEHVTQLHGCDVRHGPYDAVYASVGMTFTRLNHPYELPYEHNTFDTVIGSGVLEHAPDDDQSLRELYRVLKPGGRLIITFLPNRWSYTEWVARRFKLIHHRRRYTVHALRHQLLHRGFEPLYIGYHQVMPSLTAKAHRLQALQRLAESAYGLNHLLERTWPLRMLASNIWAVSVKRTSM